MYRITKISKLISIITLTILVFVFIDSELIENYSKWNTSQDYCEVIKGATQVSKDLTKELFKLQFNKAYCVHCIDEMQKSINECTLLHLTQFNIPNKTTEVYLFNRTLLI